MCNVVTKRFIQAVDLLKEKNLIKSGRQLAITLDHFPQSMNAILNGERDVTIDLLRKAIEHFPISAQFVFSGLGTPLLETEKEAELITAQPENNILYIPIAAQAGYSEQYFDQNFLSELTTFTLPQFKNQKGEFRCFEIQGDSMEPTLFTSEKVIGSLVRRENNYSSIRDNYVYVVATNHGIVIKRVVNKVASDGTLQLISDNSFYEPYSIPVDEVNEVWSVHVKISSFNGSPSHFQNGFQDKMATMALTIETQSEAIKGLNRSLEQLLKQHRSSNMVR
ncbi:MAG: LexA family transcriptional regulator [Saprospiraceae bacterium]|nr:LexA family transcriptional regulator [Saprospiraceae bacterium]MBP6695805.1 LexA family transcriptional regulator [Saprospiraceae bacterium]